MMELHGPGELICECGIERAVYYGRFVVRGKIYEVHVGWARYNLGPEKHLIYAIEERLGITLVCEQNITALAVQYYGRLTDGQWERLWQFRDSHPVCFRSYRSRPSGLWFERKSVFRWILKMLGPRPRCVVCRVRRGSKRDAIDVMMERSRQRSVLGRYPHSGWHIDNTHWGVDLPGKYGHTLEDVCSLSCFPEYVKRKREQQRQQFIKMKNDSKLEMEFRQARLLLRQVRATLRKRNPNPAEMVN